VRENRFHFVTRHALQQASTDGYKRRIATRASGERIHVGSVVNRDLGHLDAGLSCLAFDDVEQPGFDFIPRLRDNLGACRAFRHPFRHGERNKGSTKTDDERQHKQCLVIESRAGLIRTMLSTSITARLVARNRAIRFTIVGSPKNLESIDT
jgi:hypothetical protein